MYLIKKVSKKGSVYFTLVIKGAFDGSITYVNMGYTNGLALADMHNIKIFEDKAKEVKENENK